MKTQLCLGTAQFGLKYGVTNHVGKVSEADVGALLFQAQQAGFSFLDTAQAYGNAEAVLGRQLPSNHRFRLISKLPAQTQSDFSSQSVHMVRVASCKHLGVCRLNAVLLQSPSDLSTPGGEYLEAWLLSLRERGVVERLGVSIYSAQDLDGLNPNLLDLVQLPLSLYDQRLLQDGTLAQLRARGTAIHARSLYLQGLLLTPSPIPQEPGGTCSPTRFQNP